MPKHARMDPIFKKRFMYFLISHQVQMMAAFSYIILGNAMINIPLEYHWILALFSGVVREFFVSLIVRCASKSLGDTTEKDIIIKSKISTIHIIESAHSLHLNMVLASVATPFSTGLIIVTDFSLNIYHGLNIVYQLKFSKKENAKVEGKSCFWCLQGMQCFKSIQISDLDTYHIAALKIPCASSKFTLFLNEVFRPLKVSVASCSFLFLSSSFSPFCI